VGGVGVLPRLVAEGLGLVGSRGVGFWIRICLWITERKWQVAGADEALLWTGGGRSQSFRAAFAGVPSLLKHFKHT